VRRILPFVVASALLILVAGCVAALFAQAPAPPEPPRSFSIACTAYFDLTPAIEPLVKAEWDKFMAAMLEKGYGSGGTWKTNAAEVERSRKNKGNAYLMAWSEFGLGAPNKPAAIGEAMSALNETLRTINALGSNPCRCDFRLKYYRDPKLAPR
jgi:hypothetical protein